MIREEGADLDLRSGVGVDQHLQLLAEAVDGTEVSGVEHRQSEDLA